MNTNFARVTVSLVLIPLMFVFIPLNGALATASSASTAGLATPVPTITATTQLTSTPPVVSPTLQPTNANFNGVPSDPIAALNDTANAKTLRYDLLMQTSKAFFLGQYELVPGEDPNQVTLISIQGEQNHTDAHWIGRGVFVSLLNLFMGFAPNNPVIEIKLVGDQRFVRGVVEGATDARWYVFPPDTPNSRTSFPGATQFLQPFIASKLQASDFSKTGSEALDNRSCDVYTASGSAFQSMFETVLAGALLPQEKLDPKSIENPEFKIWLCDDGKFHQLRYAFAAIDKSVPPQKGNFAETIHFYDYDAALTVQAPTDAAPLPNPLTSLAQTSPTPATGPDGEWEGTTSDNQDLSFSVRQGKVTYAFLYFAAYKQTGCQSHGILGAGFPLTDTPLQDNHFSFKVDDENDAGVIHYSITGDLTSKTAAQGTIDIQTELKCGSATTHGTWTARNISVTSTREETTATPTSEPTTVVPTTAPTLAAPANSQVTLTSRFADVSILANGDVRFKELWTAQFSGGPFDVALHSIPLAHTTGVTDWSVSEKDKDYAESSSGAPNTFTVTNDGKSAKLTWHFTPAANQTRYFLLSYTVHGSVVSTTNGNDWAWTVIESDRGYSIGPSEVNLHLPKNFPPSQITAAAELDGKATKSVQIFDGSVLIDDGPFPSSSQWIVRVHYPLVPPDTGANDPETILKSFFDAVNAKNLDAALALADDGIIFNIDDVSSFSKADLQARIAKNTATYTLSKLETVGENVVMFAAQASDGTMYKNCSAVFSNGKIQVLALVK